MNASVVCISSVDGAESRGIGDLVADRLGFRVADGGIIVAVAQAEGLLPESVALAESREAGRTLAVDFARVERTERLRELIRASIGQAAVEGNVVIVNLCRERDIAGVAGVNDTANPRS